MPDPRAGRAAHFSVINLTRFACGRGRRQRYSRGINLLVDHRLEIVDQGLGEGVEAGALGDGTDLDPVRQSEVAAEAKSPLAQALVLIMVCSMTSFA